MKTSAADVSARPTTPVRSTSPTLRFRAAHWEIELKFHPVVGFLVRSPTRRRRLPSPGMPLDDDLLTELKRTKAEIDRLQGHLKELVARLQDQGAAPQEIAAALRE